MLSLARADPEPSHESFRDCMARRKALADQALREQDADARTKALASLPHCVVDDAAMQPPKSCKERRSDAIADAMREPDPHKRGLKLSAAPKCESDRVAPRAEPGPQTEVTACPDLDAYESAVYEHRRGVNASCLGINYGDCERERAIIEKLQSALDRCRAGQAVGPPAQVDVLVDAPPHEEEAPLVGLGVLELGGVMAVGNDAWSKSLGTSPGFAIRGGPSWGGHGFMFSGEYIDGRIVPGNVLLPPSPDIQHMRRFRVLVEGALEGELTPSWRVTGRTGLGGDFMYLDYHSNIYQGGGWRRAFAADLAGSGWYRVLGSTELGVTVAAPIHFWPVDLDLMLAVGVRIRSR